jgi:hypothetical protein
MSPGGTPALSGFSRAIRQTDAWRRPLTGKVSDRGIYREWMHFSVALPGQGPDQLLVNINLAETGVAGSVVRLPRLIALAHRDQWVGSVETFSEQDVRGRPGELGIQLGGNSLEWRRDAFELSLCTPDIQAQLRIVPLSPPTPASYLSLGSEYGLNWVALPRLEASGWVNIRGQHLRLDRALAYHDHNWGDFRWGADLAWDWGVVNSPPGRAAWSLVIVRISDGKRSRTLNQVALLWHEGKLVRTFQDRELRLTLGGERSKTRPFTVPPIASLLLPGTACGAPAQVSLDASGHGECLRLRFETTNNARVALPSDVDPFGLVVLNESCGYARVSGTTHAGACDFEGPAVMEFVRG